MLNKMYVPDFTRPRARRSNDNALVEGKNASVVRKWFGHDHIPRRFPPPVDAFSQDVLSHRRYRRWDVKTPYEKLKSLPEAERFLKPGVTFADLDRDSHASSDLEANRRANRARASCSAASAAPSPTPPDGGTGTVPPRWQGPGGNPRALASPECGGAPYGVGFGAPHCASKRALTPASTRQ